MVKDSILFAEMKVAKNNNENLHSGHRPRLRKKLLNGGADVLEEHEILEILLFHSISRKNTNEIAHRLINTFGGLFGVLNASAEDLFQIPYIKESSIVLIKAVKELIIRQKIVEGRYNFNSDYENIKSIVGKIALEIFTKGTYAIVLNKNKKLLFVCKTSKNETGGTMFRDMVKRALPCEIGGVIIFKHVKQGNIFPSSMELEFIKGVEDFLAPRNIELWEYFLVSDSEIVGVKGEEKFFNLGSFMKQGF